MRTIYKRKGLINEDGYLDNSPNKNNPVNIIPGGNITTNGVSMPLSITPVYPKGTGPSQIMYPGQNKNFAGAEYVIEKPSFLEGGVLTSEEYRQQLLSKGMLMGPELDRKVAEYDKGLYMAGVTPQIGSTIPEPSQQAPQNILTPPPPITENALEVDLKKTLTDAGIQPIGTGQAPLQTFSVPQTTDPLTAKAEETPVVPETAPAPAVVEEETIASTRPEEKTITQRVAEGQTEPGPTTPNQDRAWTQELPDDTTQHNPYGGSDMESAMSTLGASVESGNVAGIIGGGLKAGLSGFRNFKLGQSNERARRRALEEYNKRQRKGIEANSGNAITLQKGGKIDYRAQLKQIFNID